MSDFSVISPLQALARSWPQLELWAGGWVIQGCSLELRSCPKNWKEMSSVALNIKKGLSHRVDMCACVRMNWLACSMVSAGNQLLVDCVRAFVFATYPNLWVRPSYSPCMASQTHFRNIPQLISSTMYCGLSLIIWSQKVAVISSERTQSWVCKVTVADPHESAQPWGISIPPVRK